MWFDVFSSSVLLELVKTWVWFYFFFIFSVHRFLSFSQCAALQFKFKTTLLDFLLSKRAKKTSFRLKKYLKWKKYFGPCFSKGFKGWMFPWKQAVKWLKGCSNQTSSRLEHITAKLILHIDWGYAVKEIMIGHLFFQVIVLVTFSFYVQH